MPSNKMERARSCFEYMQSLDYDNEIDTLNRRVGEWEERLRQIDAEKTELQKMIQEASVRVALLRAAEPARRDQNPPLRQSLGGGLQPPSASGNTQGLSEPFPPRVDNTKHVASSPVVFTANRGALTIEVIQADITKVPVDVIVNAANSFLHAGDGVCGAIYDAAGHRELDDECSAFLRKRRIQQLAPSDCCVTSAGKMLHVRKIFHVAGPKLRRGETVTQAHVDHLQQCADAIFRTAQQLGIRSIAIPPISAGIYGFPLKLSVDILFRTAMQALLHTEGSSLQKVVLLSNNPATVAEMRAQCLSELEKLTPPVQQKSHTDNFANIGMGTSAGAKVSRSPLSPLTSSSSGAPQPLTIVSLNVLFEGYYAEHARCKTMPPRSRQDLLVDFFLKAAAGKSPVGRVDIFALQECSQDVLHLIQANVPTFRGVWGGQRKSDESTAILFDATLFEPVGLPTVTTFKTASGGPFMKTAIMQLLIHKRTQQKFAVISAHLPYESTIGGRQRVLAELSSFLDKPQYRKYVLCGDFNMDIAVSQSELAAALPPPLWADATSAQQATCLSPSGRPSKIDYIFYTTNKQDGYCLRQSNFAVWPSVGAPGASSLLPHDATTVLDKVNPFFSDHAAVAVEFALVPA